MHESRKKNKTIHYRTDETVDEAKQEELIPSVKYVTKCWDDWEAHWSSKMSDFESYYDRWIGKPPQRDEEWQANFHKRLTWQAEKALVARYHSFLFPSSAPIDYDSTEVEDALQGILGKSIVAHWFKIGLFSMEFLKAMRSAAIYGTGLVEDGWLQRVEKVYSKEEIEVDDFRKSINGEGGFVYDENGNVQVESVGKKKVIREKGRNTVVEDRYRIQKGNIFAWKIHPDKLSDEDDYPAIKQEFITFDDLVDREKELAKYGITAFDNMDKIKKDRFKAKEGDITRHRKDGAFKDQDNPKLEILHYWGKYSDDDKEKECRWIQVVNRKYELKNIINPYWHKKPPVIHINWTDDEKPSYYGIGIPQIGASAEDRANTTINIRTDERKKNVKGGGWYNALDKKIKKSQVQKTIPGLYKPCSDVNNAVRPDPIIPSTPDDYKEEEVAVNDHREITGATTSLLPTADEKQQHDTLGGMQLLIGQASMRLKPDLVSMEMNGIRKIANRGLLLTLQFQSKAENMELMASTDEKRQYQLGKMHKLSPGEIMSKMNFYCTGLSESIEKGQNIDKLMKYAEVTAKVPAMQMVTNYEAIAKRIALWLGFEDIEEFVKINPDDPLTQAVQSLAGGQPPGMPGQPQQIPQAGGGLPPDTIKQIASQVGQRQQ